MGLGLGRLASKADLLDLPSMLSIVAGDSGGRLRSLLEGGESGAGGEGS